jgi:hypothetical protein
MPFFICYAVNRKIHIITQLYGKTKSFRKFPFYLVNFMIFQLLTFHLDILINLLKVLKKYVKTKFM